MQTCVVFDDFCNWISSRTGLMTEDNIRYYWFAAMLKHDNDLNNYTLENPYLTLEKKELDLLYTPNNGDVWAIEMKFHKKRFLHLLILMLLVLFLMICFDCNVTKMRKT